MLPPLPGSVRALASKPQITKKQFELIKSVFDEYDTDDDGSISEKEFVVAVLRLDEKRAEREGERVRSRFLNKDIGDTVGAMAELRALKGEAARSKHAVSMFRTVVEKTGQLQLVDMLALYFPHLPRTAVERAYNHHAEKPAPPPPKKSFEQRLDEAPGARDEIKDIFEALDGDRDGLVRMKSLEPMMVELGITEKDIEGWLAADGMGMIRMKSRLDVDDMQRLLGSAYIAPSPKSNAGSKVEKEIKKQIEWDQNLALEVMYGKPTGQMSTVHVH